MIETLIATIAVTIMSMVFAFLLLKCLSVDAFVNYLLTVRSFFTFVKYKFKIEKIEPAPVHQIHVKKILLSCFYIDPYRERQRP